LKEVQQTYNISFATTNSKELVKREEIDIISVATPDFYQREHSVEVFLSGKHVLCEKSLA